MARKAGGIYVPLDVDYPDNPRIIEANEEAELLYVRGLCLAKKNRKDGFIDRRQLSRVGLPNVYRRAAALIRVGLWSAVKEDDKVIGYIVVGFLDRNDSAAELDELSKKRAQAGAIGGRAGSKPKAEDFGT